VTLRLLWHVLSWLLFISILEKLIAFIFKVDDGAVYFSKTRVNILQKKCVIPQMAATFAVTTTRTSKITLFCNFTFGFKVFQM